jgi:hypothetical protein
MTRNDIRQRILRALNDDPTAPVYWTTAEIDTYIDEGLEVLVELAPALKRTFTVPRREGQLLYDLAGVGANIQTPYRIWLPDLHRRLHPWSLTDLDAHHEQWMTVHGSPWVWAPVDWSQFVIWPIPGTGGGWLEVSCYVWPDALEADGDIPEVLPADHESLVVYGEMLGQLKQYNVGRALELAQRFLSRWGRARDRSSIEQLLGAMHQRSRHDG